MEIGVQFWLRHLVLNTLPGDGFPGIHCSFRLFTAAPITRRTISLEGKTLRRRLANPAEHSLAGPRRG